MSHTKKTNKKIKEGRTSKGKAQSLVKECGQKVDGIWCVLFYEWSRRKKILKGERNRRAEDRKKLQKMSDKTTERRVESSNNNKKEVKNKNSFCHETTTKVENGPSVLGFRHREEKKWKLHEQQRR
jgi:hypothetical protein